MKIHGTAKGGALSTKDFGVAFGGAAAAVCTTYPDSITTTANGVVSGAVINTTDQLFGSGCLSFDQDEDNFVNVDGLIPAMRGTVGSISIWYRLPESKTGYMFMFGDTDGDSYINMSAESASGVFGTEVLGRDSGSTVFKAAKSGLALDEWHNNTLVQDGTTVKFYVDNVDISFSNTTDMSLWIGNDLDNVRIGCGRKNDQSEEDFYSGLLQGACFWDVAISDDVRNHIWNSGTGRQISQLCPTYNSDDIIAWYNMQSLTNSTLVNNATPVS